jgi:hypothetical protein
VWLLIVYSNTKSPNTNCSYFYDFLGAILWALINQGSKFHSKKIVTGPRVTVNNQYKKDNRWPNSQQRRSEFTNHHRPWHWPTRQRSQANRARAAQNFSPIFTIVPMKFQLLHRAVKGTLVVSSNKVTRTIHIRLLARQIHNARILPTAAASRPTRLHRSLLTVALLFSSPTAPYVMTVMRKRLLACGRMSGQPKDGWCGSVDVVPGHDDELAGRLRPRAAVDPPPPSITRTTTSFATEVSPAWTPNTLSLIGHQNWSTIYSCQCGLIMETCLDSSSLIDWL